MTGNTWIVVKAGIASVAALLVLHGSVIAGPPGVVIDRSPDPQTQYVGSPSLAVLPHGDYVASHDWFGPGTGYNRVRVLRSTDRGQTWQALTDVTGQFWSNLFVHRDALYVFGTRGRYGNVVIRRSSDGGRTWTEPKDEHTGLLTGDAGYHCAPVPMAIHNGRIWRAMEDNRGAGGWGTHFRAFMMSAPVDADLLQRSNWTCSNRLAGDPTWLDGKFNGWLEGNAVVSPGGDVVNILRVDSPHGGKAAIVRTSADGRTATFDPEHDFIDLPGGAKKFTIRYDEKTRCYWSLTNPVRDRDRPISGRAGRVRNMLALVSSPDLHQWTVRSIVLYHADIAKHGFQYVDWLFDGDDLIAVSRTAYDDDRGQAHNQHDANYLTFHRIVDFRLRSMGDAADSSPQR